MFGVCSVFLCMYVVWLSVHGCMCTYVVCMYLRVCGMSVCGMCTRFVLFVVVCIVYMWCVCSVWRMCVLCAYV